MKNGLDVFDFKEEDELLEYSAGKILGKFKNPSLYNPDILKSAHGSNIVKKGRSSDANEGDNTHNSSNNGTISTSLETVREDFATQDTSAGPDAAFQSRSPRHEDGPCPEMDTFESKHSFTEIEARFSCGEAPSPRKSQSTCALVASPFNSGPVNVKPEDDGSDESSPSSSISNIAENDAIVNPRSSDICFSAPDMDAINIAADYVLFRDNYYSGCMVTFSSDGIKISGDPGYGEQENFCFERAIEAIIHIESRQLRRFGTGTIKLHFLPKDAAQDVNADGVELLEFALVEPNWSGKFEEIASLNVKYSSVSSTAWDMDFQMDGGADILQRRPYFPTFDEALEDVVYPKGDIDAVSISKRDFDLLQPETFVNDTIIDFYIKYLKSLIPPEERHRFHFFNSFFFRKLADLDKDPSSASDGRAAFLRVHKWTRKVDIFGKDYVFIPVNFSLHWSLLVICHPGEVAGFKDEDLGKSLRVPCILHMDSIKGTHAGLKNLVQSYLWEEWRARQKDTSDDLSTKFFNLRFVPLELPQQENSFDCGLFLLHYLELFLVEAPPNFSPFKINKSSKFLTVDWFPPAEASLKRTLIQRLISGLLDNHNRELSFGDCSDEPESSFPQNNMKETAVQLVSERCTSAVACHGKISSSDTSQGIEITLLQSSMRNADCVNDPGLVLRELFEPGVAAGSLLAECSSFDQPSYYRHNDAVSQQIEDDEETEEPFVYFPSGDAIFQQAGGMAPQSGSIPYSLRECGAEPSWNPGISVQGEDDAFSPETSTDDSDVGIIENCPVQKDLDLCQSHGIDKQVSQSMEKMECLAGTLESSVMKISEDLDRVHDGNEKGKLAFCQEDTTTLHRDLKMVENGPHQQSEEAEITSDDAQAAEPDEKQRLGHEVMVESDENQICDKLKAKSGEKQSNGSNVSMESDDCNVIGESDEKQLMEDSNLKGESDEMQRIEDNSVMAQSDEHPGAKRRRVEGEDQSGNLRL
ncbi:probable ubiquitin-like-specific protease 2B isoform X2 [Euphorbia lathyris]|uniref:probable ubiquitin-like-specific protease 2B isoform X2 n=1 Tax=Euphorbia lathyris TaxID=212925 RepID=UPI003313C846